MMIEIKGLDKVIRIMANLPKELKKEGDKAIIDLAQNLQRRIRFRYMQAGYGAGVTSTGFGLKSIVREGNVIMVLAPYLAMIERGVRSHWVSQEIMELHMGSPGSTVGQTAEGLGLAPPYMGPPFWWQYKGPFVAPARESFMPDIPKILERYLNNAISKSRR